MIHFDSIGKTLIILGLVLVAAGGVLLLFKQIPFLGKLPGDMLIQKKNFTFYFPLSTSILISVLVTLLFYLFNKR